VERALQIQARTPGRLLDGDPDHILEVLDVAGGGVKAVGGVSEQVTQARRQLIATLKQLDQAYGDGKVIVEQVRHLPRGQPDAVESGLIQIGPLDDFEAARWLPSHVTEAVGGRG
jgi:hypothetical protein